MPGWPAAAAMLRKPAAPTIRGAAGSSNLLAVGALLAGNLFPLYAVLALGWSVFQVLVLYWTESVIIGAYTLLELVIVARRQSLVLAPFFGVHYGMFMFVHLVFLLSFFGPGAAPMAFPDAARWAPFGIDADSLQATLAIVLPGLLGLVASHGVSFVTNVLRDWRRAAPQAIMMRPYGRVFFMQLVVILGGFLVMSIGSPAPALAVVVVGKLVVDLLSHLRLHRARRAAVTEPRGGTKTQTRFFQGDQSHSPLLQRGPSRGVASPRNAEPRQPATFLRRPR